MHDVTTDEETGNGCVDCTLTFATPAEVVDHVRHDHTAIGRAERDAHNLALARSIRTVGVGLTVAALRAGDQARSAT